MSSKNKFSLKKLFTIIAYTLISLIVVYNATLIFKSIISRDETPSFFGIKSFVVVSGSMEPNIEIGDYIFVKSVDTEDIKVGDVISFRSGNSVVTHRVEEIVNDKGEIKYKTKGDSNNIEDKELVPSSAVEGLYIRKISKLGKVILALNNKLVLIVVLILLYLIIKRGFKNDEKIVKEEKNIEKKEKVKKTNNRNKMVVLIYFLVISTVLLTTFSLAKYKGTWSTEKTARVAIMANDVVYSVNGVKAKPGDETIIPISIRNYEDDRTCEVSEAFTLKINMTTNIPLTYALYSDVVCENLVRDDGNGNYYDENFNFEAANRESKTYYLKINWPRLENDSYYADEIDSINIYVNVEQID